MRSLSFLTITTKKKNIWRPWQNRKTKRRTKQTCTPNEQHRDERRTSELKQIKISTGERNIHNDRNGVKKNIL